MKNLTWQDPLQPFIFLHPPFQYHRNSVQLEYHKLSNYSNKHLSPYLFVVSYIPNR